MILYTKYYGQIWGDTTKTDKGSEHNRCNNIMTENANYYADLKPFVRMAATGAANGLMIKIPPELDEDCQFKIQKTIEKEVGEYGYKTVSGSCTPLELYHQIFEMPPNGVLFLANADELLKNRSALAPLKQATETGDRERIVSWYSTTSRLEAPQEFSFSGSIIFTFLNEPKSNVQFDALKSRCHYHQI